MKTMPNESIHLSPDVTQDGRIIGTEPGLTKREYFALHLMAAYAGADYVANSGYPSEDIAKRGVEMADALIDTLNK